MAESAFDGSPADRDAGPGPEEPGLSWGGPGAEDSSRGLGEDRDPVGSALPQRVRGMSDGPRPPAQVARPVLPPSFLERVRAAAEAEQRLLERAQERADPPAQTSYGATRGTASPATFLSGAATGWPGTRTRRTGPEAISRGRRPTREAAGDQSLTDRQARVSSDLWTAHKGAEPGQAQTPAGPGVLGPDEGPRSPVRRRSCLAGSRG